MGGGFLLAKVPALLQGLCPLQSPAVSGAFQQGEPGGGVSPQASHVGDGARAGAAGRRNGNTRSGGFSAGDETLICSGSCQQVAR